MKHVSALLSAIFNRSPDGQLSYAIPNPLEKEILRNFSLTEALAGKPFKLRGGMTFETLSLNHHIEDDPRPRVLIQIEGQPLPFCYYDDGIWNELDYSDYDLVMVD